MASDILKISSILKQGMTALDVGCGEGRNSIYLAGLGLNVDAFDISEAGVTKLKRIAEENGVKVNAWVQDLTTYLFNKTYDVIVCHGVLHLVEKHEWQRIIKAIKINTNSRGLNIIGVFTDTLPAAPDLVAFTKALFNEGELKELYSDWNIIEFNTYVFEDEHPGGIHHKHAANNIIAVKK
jgi:tellurite methyltransferase